MAQNEIIALIKLYADKHNLDPSVVYGVCMQESLLNQYAARYEPHYRWLYHPAKVKPRWCSLDTEVTLQKTSMGLMQVMGAVYREHGFDGWLSKALASPRVQLDYGCRHLARKMAKYGFSRGILAYNSGSPRKDESGQYVNQYYLDRVLGYRKDFLDADY